MAICATLQPVVLLTDIMESKISESEVTSTKNIEPQTKTSRQLHLEQTEPLNLCLNGTIINGFTMVECFPKQKENGKLTKENDDDVIFVKEYKVNGEKTVRRSSSQCSKGAPRRNPVRKARITKRFEEEYTDIDFDEDEIFVDATDDENFQESAENVVSNGEDSEDWKIEDAPKKHRQKRRVFHGKLKHRLGRKRKFTDDQENEKKESLKDLESIIESNLLLIKDYIDGIKTVSKLSKEKFDDIQKIKEGIDIFKQQAILLSIIKETGFDILEFVIQ